MRSQLLVTLLFLATGALGCATREGAAPTSAALVAPTPEARLRALSLRGSRASPSIGMFVRERHAQLQLCWDDARVGGDSRDATAGRAGKATIAVMLDDAGRVTGAIVADRSWRDDGAGVERCLLGTVRRWRFPAVAPDGQHAHSFAVVFSGGGTGTAETAPR